MKRNILMGLVGAVVATTLSQSVDAQGTIKISSGDTSMGLFLGNFTTSAPTSTYVELLGGSSAGNLAGLVASGTGTAIFQLSTAGSGYQLAPNGAGTGSYFNAGYGSVAGVASGGTGYFQLLAWQGASSFASATYQFASAVWSEAVGSPYIAGPPSVPASPTLMGTVQANNGGVDGFMILNTPATGLYNNSITGGNYGFALVSAPEPSSLALAGLGGFGMLMAFRRKKA